MIVKYGFPWSCLLKYSKKINREDIILDAGCGDGTLITHLKFKGFRNVIGLDVSSTFIRRVTENCIISDATYLPFRLSVFKVVLMTKVLEHLENPFKTIQGVNKSLKNGGYFIFSIPSANYPLRLLKRYHKEYIIGQARNHHISCFDYVQIKILFYLCNFKLIRLKGFGRMFPNLLGLGRILDKIFSNVEYFYKYILYIGQTSEKITKSNYKSKLGDYHWDYHLMDNRIIEVLRKNSRDHINFAL